MHDEFRRLWLERFALTLLFLVAAVLYMWVFSALSGHVAPWLRLGLNMVMLGLFYLLWREIHARRKRLLEMMGRGKQ